MQRSILFYIFSLFRLSGSTCLNSLLSGTRCYKVLPGLYEFDEAAERCEQDGFEMATPNDADKWNELRTFLHDNGISSSWLGATGRDLDWHWSFDNSVVAPQGCYKDSSLEHDLPMPVSADQPTQCFSACKKGGYSYAGLQNRSLCYCGHSYGRYGVEQSEDNPGCSSSCDAIACGGYDRNSVYFVDGGYGRWANLQPNNKGGHQFCGALDITQRDFADENCYEKFPFICRIPGNLTCRDSEYWHNQSSTCLLVGRTHVTWFEAHAYCRARNADLLHVHSFEGHHAVKVLLWKIQVTDPVWIGLTRVRWSWVKRTETMTFSDWSPTHPKRAGSRCLIARFFTPNPSKWMDTDCSLRHPVVCQAQPGMKKPTDKNFTTTDGHKVVQVFGKDNFIPRSLDLYHIVLICALLLLLIALLSFVGMFCFVRKKNRNLVQVEPDSAQTTGSVQIFDISSIVNNKRNKQLPYNRLDNNSSSSSSLGKLDYKKQNNNNNKKKKKDHVDLRVKLGQPDQLEKSRKRRMRNIIELEMNKRKEAPAEAIDGRPLHIARLHHCRQPQTKDLGPQKYDDW